MKTLEKKSSIVLQLSQNQRFNCMPEYLVEFIKNFRSSESWVEKRNLIEQLNCEIIDSTSDFSHVNKDTFLSLFNNSESPEEKVQKLIELNPYNIGFKGIIALVEILRISSLPIGKNLTNILEEQYGISQYYGNFGTGGDKRGCVQDSVKINTLNISTIASIIAGSVWDDTRKQPLCPMVKVGSPAVTSKIGAANLMSMIRKSYPDPVLMGQQLSRFGFVFVSPGDLQIPYSDSLIQARRTIFQKGLCDPIKIIVPAACLTDPKVQLTGVSDLRLLPFIIKVFEHLIQLGVLEKGVIVHSYDGIDELFNDSLLIEVTQQGWNGYDLSPAMFGLRYGTQSTIAECSSGKEQFEVSKQIISGSPKISPDLMDVIVWNAAILLAFKNDLSSKSKAIRQISQGIDKIREVILSGRANTCFEQYMAFEP